MELARRLQAALGANGEPWHTWLSEQLSIALAASDLSGFDAIVEPAVDGEPVACFSTRQPEAKMNRHLRAFIRLAKELDPTITGGWVQRDADVEGHGIHVVVLRRDPTDPVLQGSRTARRVA